MASNGGEEFVEGWIVAQVLGEGAYGEVRLLVHARSGASVALKCVRDVGTEGGGAAGREAALHRALRHAHVLRCLGARHHPPHHYMFLEYAHGGELFDRIEPDVGTGEGQARVWWRQLMGGLQYLHGRGVAHRDVKPENLLLDERDNIKISDFGLATVFRHGSRERLLSRVCGTVVYAAPEVLSAERRPYRAPPADLWAAGVVLLAMLTGELPWERADEEDARFAAWGARCAVRGDPAARVREEGVWRKVRGGAWRVVRDVLQPAASARPDLAVLLQYDWLRDTANADADTADAAEGGGACRERAWCSQPAGRGAVMGAEGGEGDGALSAAAMDALISFSQPADDDALLADRSQHTQGGAGVVSRLVRRATRVWVRAAEGAALAALGAELTARRIPHALVHPRIMAIEWGEVRMRAWAVRVCGVGGEESGVVLEFRRSRGCGLQFKRRFGELRAALAHIATSPPPGHGDLLAAPLHPLYHATPPHTPMDHS